jgi:beta-galactosidase/beta-glucuronidase
MTEPQQRGPATGEAGRSIESILSELGQVPRPEHPRPDRLRAGWHNLNGAWEFEFDPDDRGREESWQDRDTLGERRIVVPFAPESILSGVHDEEFHPLCWYARDFDLPAALASPPLAGREGAGERASRILLHFGAVDTAADVWLNGQHLGQHVGGYDPFDFDVTAVVRPAGNRLAVRVHDDPAEVKPKGKQSKDLRPSGCAYMRVTGIWQTVWLESVGSTFVRDWIATADPDTGTVALQVRVDGAAADLQLEAEVTATDQPAVRAKAAVAADGPTALALTVPNPDPWTPETPALYDLDLRLVNREGDEIDRVRSYLGFRRIEIRDGQYRLNGEPIFFASALDQGYHPEGLYTPPTDAVQREDVLWAKRYGLNGIRKHQIVPEPRFLYWCDRLGLLAWGEMADWGANIKDTDAFLSQWRACLLRDINHPSIITWVPTNEVKEPDNPDMSAAKVRIYEETRALDPTRPVIDTSGYCHTKTDIVDLHVNPPDGDACRAWWEDWRRSIAETGNFPAWPDSPTYCDGFRHEGQPVIISETGNWWISEWPPQGPWEAYGTGPLPTVDAFLDRYRDFFTALMAEPECAGFSYVQLYDVEGEVNGYLTYDRRPKMPPDAIRAIHAEGLRLRALAGAK